MALSKKKKKKNKKKKNNNKKKKNKKKNLPKNYKSQHFPCGDFSVKYKDKLSWLLHNACNFTATYFHHQSTR
jgi:hypothetical protein